MNYRKDILIFYGELDGVKITMESRKNFMKLMVPLSTLQSPMR